MKAIIPDIDEQLKRPYYLQLYDYIKNAILSGEISKDERLPSLRSLAQSLKLSITTIEQAYNQLSVEGYIYSRPQSGYFAADIFSARTVPMEVDRYCSPLQSTLDVQTPIYYYDPDCFDFNKWKKCLNKVITLYSSLLFFEGDPQGEEALRYELAKYLYQSRGVTCEPGQILIGAGTQQITNYLATILKKQVVGHIAMEDPGYIPVKQIFKDRGFSITPIAVDPEGITISKLPSNIRSAVYVSPSNQVPTGAVMPAGRRLELIDWAIKNDSFIIEDDYDSELRYFGKPIPALQSLDTHGKVIYLGSFSSTLFPSIKISYMVLPQSMSPVFQAMREDYTQTCSKMEQLTLALFMEQGFYQTNIKKLRNLYGQKLQLVVNALRTDFTDVGNTSSGINIMVNIKGKKTAATLCREAKSLKIPAVPSSLYTGSTPSGTASLILYYNQIPLSNIRQVMADLIAKWRQV